jgi:hypothetical protein
MITAAQPAAALKLGPGEYPMSGQRLPLGKGWDLHAEEWTAWAIVHPINSAGAFTADEADLGRPFIIDGSYLQAGHYVRAFSRGAGLLLGDESGSGAVRCAPQPLS